jgi:putative effector of murein hydrolase
MVELHSIVRWLVLLTAVAALGSLFAVRLRGSWDPLTEWLARSYALAITLQLLLGVIVWVTGGWWRADSTFLAWVHPAMGVAATGLAHAGVARARKADDPRVGATAGLVLVTLSVVLVILAVPRHAWPL